MASRFGSIPEWNHSGLLPPFIGSPTSAGQSSPYSVGLTDLVLRYGDTVFRRTLLTGLLDFRADLHNAGVQQGFQWVNGSFVENTMQRSQHEPNDIDVVTCFRLPDKLKQATLEKANPSLFDPATNKQKYGLDAYFIVLDQANIPFLVKRIVYWHSLWSHNRYHQWKGYLEIDLSDSEDAAARAALDEAAAREKEA